MSKITEQDKKLAFDTGVAAFVNQMFDANPYKDGTDKHKEFVKGWTKAKIDHYKNQGI